MKKITFLLMGILLILGNVAKADTGDITATTFTPTAGKVYRIFSYGQYNGSSSLTTVRKYLTINGSGTIGYTETYDATNMDLLWTITNTGTNYTFYNFNQGKYMNSYSTAGNTSSAPGFSTTLENYTLTYVKQITSNSTTSSGFYILNSTPKCLELATSQYTLFFKNGSADRPRMEWGFQEIDAPITTLPTIAMSTGNSAQTVYQNQIIKTSVFKWGGTATSATVVWSGTISPTTAPDGVTVSTDATGKTITISGALTTLGSYGYSITSSDGTNTSTAVTGTLNTKTTTKYKMAYVTTVTAGAPAAGDLYFINGFSNNPGNDGLSKDFDLTYISATDTGIDYSIYDVILESSIPSSGSAGLAELKSKCLSKPFVNMKEFQLQASAWAWGTPANTTATTIVVPDAAKTHPVFSGITFSGALSNEIILTTATTGNMAVNLTVWTGTPTPIVPIVLSTVKDVTGLGGYFEIPVGTTMNGMSTPTSAKQVVLGLSEATYNTTNLLTADAITLAVNAAKYVIAPVPTISLTSGSNAQTKLPNTAITNVVYTYGGTVTTTNIVWTGTTNSTTAPDGITVTTDGTAKTISISGTPTTEGVYGYTVSATDGALVPSLSGSLTITINTGIQSLQNSKTISSKEFFDITGKKVNEFSRGLLIEKSIYTDGSNSFKKVYRAEFQQ